MKLNLILSTTENNGRISQHQFSSYEDALRWGIENKCFSKVLPICLEKLTSSDVIRKLIDTRMQLWFTLHEVADGGKIFKHCDPFAPAQEVLVDFFTFFKGALSEFSGRDADFEQYCDNFVVSDKLKGTSLSFTAQEIMKTYTKSNGKLQNPPKQIKRPICVINRPFMDYEYHFSNMYEAFFWAAYLKVPQILYDCIDDCVTQHYSHIEKHIRDDIVKLAEKFHKIYLALAQNNTAPTESKPCEHADIAHMLCLVFTIIDEILASPEQPSAICKDGDLSLQFSLHGPHICQEKSFPPLIRSMIQVYQHRTFSANTEVETETMLANLKLEAPQTYTPGLNELRRTNTENGRPNAKPPTEITKGRVYHV